MSATRFGADAGVVPITDLRRSAERIASCNQTYIHLLSLSSGRLCPTSDPQADFTIDTALQIDTGEAFPRF